MQKSAISLVVMLGPPGAGKSTQSKLLGNSLKLPVISCGDVFRQHIERNTEFGNAAKSYIDRGKLTPDSLTSSMILNVVRNIHGDVAVIEGFPRTIGQLEYMRSNTWIDSAIVSSAILLDANDDELLARISSRRICPTCGEVYSIRYNISIANCTSDGSTLLQRRDDRPEIIRPRIRLYRTEEDPVIEYYRSTGKLKEFDADQGVEYLHFLLQGHLRSLSA